MGADPDQEICEPTCEQRKVLVSSWLRAAMLSDCFSDSGCSPPATRAHHGSPRINMTAIDLFVKAVRTNIERERECAVHELQLKITAISRLAEKVPKENERVPSAPSMAKGARVMLARVRKPPRSLTWARISVNYRAPSDGRGLDGEEDNSGAVYVPYLGDSERQLNRSDTLAMDLRHHQNGKKVYESDCEGDSASMRTPDAKEDFEYFQKFWTFFERKNVMRRAFMRRCVLETLEHFGRDAKSVQYLAYALRISKSSVVAYDALARSRLKEWRSFDEEVESQRIRAIEQASSARGDSLAILNAEQFESSDSFSAFFCRQCYNFDCHVHGINYPLPREALLDETRRDVSDRGNLKPCGKDCFLKYTDKTGTADVASRFHEQYQPPSRAQVTDMKVTRSSGVFWRLPDKTLLSDKTVSMIKALRDLFGDDFCAIRKLACISPTTPSYISCTAVALTVMLLLPSREEPSDRVWRKPPSKKRKIFVPQEELMSLTQGARIDYMPCNHSGSCSAKKCSCATRGINCEKYCSCYRTRTSGERVHALPPCPRQFRGCSCRNTLLKNGQSFQGGAISKAVGRMEGKSEAAVDKPSAMGEDVVKYLEGVELLGIERTCNSTKCPCVMAKRECDPDLCRNCGTAEPVGSSRCCANSSLSHREHVKYVVAESNVHGWGVFAQEFVKKGRCVGEYVGEWISQNEAERRGRVYDELNSSFLFNVTKRFAVDATRSANDFKFCNHSNDPNMTPCLMRVRGDVKIGFYAARDIEAGEELFFDYGYSNVASHIARWARSKASKKGKPVSQRNVRRSSASKIARPREQTPAISLVTMPE